MLIRIEADIATLSFSTWWIIAEALSLVLCTYFLVMMSKVGRSTRSRLLPKQLVQRAGADLVLSIGGALQICTQIGLPNLIWNGSLEYPSAILFCEVPIFILWTGRAVSLLTEAHIVTAFACSVLGRDWAKCLNATLSWAVVGGIVEATIEMYFARYRLTHSSGVFCCVPQRQDIVGATFLATCFGRTALTFVWLNIKLFRFRGPRFSNSAAAMWRSFCYVLTFALPYSLDAYAYVAGPVGQTSASWIWPTVLGLECMTGFLNISTFLALMHYVSFATRAGEVSLFVSRWDSEPPTPTVGTHHSHPPLLHHAVGDLENSACSEPHNEPFGPVNHNPFTTNGGGRALSVHPFERKLLQCTFFLEGLDIMPDQNRRRNHSFCSRPGHFSSSHGEASHICPNPSTLGVRPLAQHCISAYTFSSAGAEHAPLSFEQILIREQLIGAGSFGDVYLARARGSFGGLESSVSYAAKFQRSDRVEPGKKKYLYKERNILQSLSHPGIVKLYSSWKFEHPQMTFVLVMEYCAGGSLSRKISRDGLPGLRIEMCKRYAAETLSALCYLHSRDPIVLHRDIKPANVLLTTDGPTGRCKLADFGFSTDVPANTMLGTMGFLAPEIVLQNIYGMASDIYAWGKTLAIMFGGANIIQEQDIEQQLILVDPGCPIALVLRTIASEPGARGTALDLTKDMFFDGVDWDRVFLEPVPAPSISAST